MRKQYRFRAKGHDETTLRLSLWEGKAESVEIRKCDRPIVWFVLKADSAETYGDEAAKLAQRIVNTVSGFEWTEDQRLVDLIWEHHGSLSEVLELVTQIAERKWEIWHSWYELGQRVFEMKYRDEMDPSYDFFYDDITKGMNWAVYAHENEDCFAEIVEKNRETIYVRQ